MGERDFIGQKEIGFVGKMALDRQEDLQELKEILNRAGVQFVCTQGEDKHVIMFFRWSKYMVDRKQTRNAGARKVYPNKDITVLEVRERMKTESADDIAKSLGISRATLFRRLKAAEKSQKETI
ncbi:MAG: hypothetical protein IKW21_04310 [Lachnospiraceae bacterium]|nr:hypothetical protein [Lachnospiraceae bacterium]